MLKSKISRVFGEMQAEKIDSEAFELYKQGQIKKVKRTNLVVDENVLQQIRLSWEGFPANHPKKKKYRAQAPSNR